MEVIINKMLVHGVEKLVCMEPNQQVFNWVPFQDSAADEDKSLDPQALDNVPSLRVGSRQQPLRFDIMTCLWLL